MTVDRKKELAAFYTPNLVTEVLCAWAIRSKTDILLEPSFGGCNFLTSSIKRLETLANKNPINQIYGFDIDPAAFKILKKLGLSGSRFIKKDFLKSIPKNLPEPVSVILGNPPYLPIQKLEECYRIDVLKKIQYGNIKIEQKASLWVYFILHSLNYLKYEGRMAWIVPDSIAFTDYGKKFLCELSRSFKSIRLLRIKERYFFESGTYEKTAILLCEGFCLESSGVEIYEYETLEKALSQISTNSFEKSNEASVVTTFNGVKFESCMLGDIFDVRIGIVVGATKLLTIKTGDVEKSPYYPQYVYPLITKGRQLQNVSINRSKLTSLRHSPAYIINGLKLETENKELYSVLCKSLPEEVKDNATFKKRQHPFGYDDFRYPNAFLTYFAQKLPRLIENENQELNCTNSIHRLYYKEKYNGRTEILRFTALQLFCSFLGKQTEILAREYGNSILKYEPSDASKIPVIIPKIYTEEFGKEIDECFAEVKRLVDISRIEDAKTEALSFLENAIISSEMEESLTV